MTTAVGRYSFAVLLFQDLAVAPLLFMVAMLARRTDEDVALGLALTVAPAALAVGARHRASGGWCCGRCFIPSR